MSIGKMHENFGIINIIPNLGEGYGPANIEYRLCCEKNRLLAVLSQKSYNTVFVRMLV